LPTGLFLFDGDPNSIFQIGGYGQYLGYISMKPAYLGIGFDEYDYFGATLTRPVGIPSPGVRLHSIAIGNAAYGYVDGTLAYLQNILGLPTTITPLAYTTATATRPDDATIYRRVKIEMEPIFGGMSVTVYMKTETTGGDFVKIIGPVDVIQPTPTTLRLRFAASTGSSWAYHEVRDVEIRPPTTSPTPVVLPSRKSRNEMFNVCNKSTRSVQQERSLWEI
jgi:hypothetical protein